MKILESIQNHALNFGREFGFAGASTLAAFCPSWLRRHVRSHSRGWYVEMEEKENQNVKKFSKTL